MHVNTAKITVVIDRAVVAEPRAAGDQVEVEVVAGGVVGDGQADDEDDDRREQDAEHGVGVPCSMPMLAPIEKSARKAMDPRAVTPTEPRSSAGRCAAHSGRHSPRGCPPRPPARCLPCSQWHPLRASHVGLIVAGPCVTTALRAGSRSCRLRSPWRPARLSRPPSPPSPVLECEAAREHEVLAPRPRARSRCAARRAARRCPRSPAA